MLKKAKEIAEKCDKESYSLPRGLANETRTLAITNRDNINRRVEEGLRVQNARYKGLPALRARLAIGERDETWLHEDNEKLRAQILELEQLEANTAKRHSLDGYDERIARVAEDLQEDPQLKSYLPDRARIISKDFHVRSDIVIEDINGVSA